MTMPTDEISTPQPPSPPLPRTVAIFDFDNTLVEGDSMWPFLNYACGWPYLIGAVLRAAALYARKRLARKGDPDIADTRSYIKGEILYHLLSGKAISWLRIPIMKIQKWAKWKEDMLRLLLEHQAKGHDIVIASGGLNLYLPAILDSVLNGNYTLICTEMESLDGMLTGYIYGGNCVRQVKAERVAAWLEANGPFADSWGYGNYPDDVAMLELVKQRIIV